MKKINFPDIFSNKNFCLLLASQLLSNVAATTIFFSIINIVFLKLASSSVIALITILYYLPGTLLGVLAGAVVDKVDKKKLFLFSSLAQIIIALLFLSIKRQIFLAFPLVLFYSLFDELFNPAMGAILPNVVKKEDLGSANTLWFFAAQGSIILGSLLSGLVLSLTTNYQLVFFLVALMLGGAIAAILLVPEEFLNHQKNLKKLWEDFNPEKFLSDIQDSLFFLKRNKLVLFPILFLALIQTFIGAAISIAPVLAQTLNVPITGASLFIVTPGLVGAIVGGAWASQVIKKGQLRKKALIINGLFFSGISLLLIFLASLSTLAPYFVWFLLIGLGLSFILTVIPARTLIQEHAPFEVRGRIYGILNMLISLAGMLPLLLIASLVDLIGIKAVILITGFILVILAKVFHQNQDHIFQKINQK